MGNSKARKKEAHKELCKNGSEENKVRHKNMRNRTKKVAAKTMRREAKKEMENLREKPYKVL